MQVGGAPAEELRGRAIRAHELLHFAVLDRSTVAAIGVAPLLDDRALEVGLQVVERPLPCRPPARHTLLEHPDRNRRRAAVRHICRRRGQRRHPCFGRPIRQPLADLHVGIIAGREMPEYLQHVAVAEEDGGVALLELRDLRAQRRGIGGEHFGDRCYMIHLQRAGPQRRRPSTAEQVEHPRRHQRIDHAVVENPGAGAREACHHRCVVLLGNLARGITRGRREDQLIPLRSRVGELHFDEAQEERRARVEQRPVGEACALDGLGLSPHTSAAA